MKEEYKIIPWIWYIFSIWTFALATHDLYLIFTELAEILNRKSKD